MKNIYPNILISKRNNGFLHETKIRLKRNEKWYDLIIKKLCKHKSIDSIKDEVMISYLWWKPLRINKPSKDQTETIYNDLDNIHWQNRIINRLSNF